MHHHKCSLTNDTDSATAAISIIDAINLYAKEVLLQYSIPLEYATTTQTKAEAVDALINKMTFTLFSQKDKNEINKYINNSLLTLHKHYIYHRDLGRNYRNLILV